jgi:hypothetical protein
MFMFANWFNQKKIMNYVGLLSIKNIYMMNLIFDNRNIKGSSSHKLIY